MRRLLPLIVLLAPLAVLAQQPPRLEPLPEPPPPAVGIEDNPDAPGITLQRGEDQVEEFEVDGQKYIRVTQPNASLANAVPLLRIQYTIART